MNGNEADNRAIVRVLYTALLNRDPDPKGWELYTSVLDRKEKTPHQLAFDFLASAEFREKSTLAGRELMSLTDFRIYAGYKLEDLTVFNEFSHAQPPPRSGFLTEFVGSVARISLLWDGCQNLDGKVLPLPIPNDYHADAIEWLGMLKAVRAATGSFAAMELGAGHGPWIAASAAAARLRGINDLRLCAVEGDPARFALLQQNIEDNDLTRHDITLIQAAVGTTDGSARWPRVSDPRNTAGARPLRDGNQDDATYLRDLVEDTIEVEVVSASRLLMSRRIWDLVHIDVQGTEAELCAASLETLSERVRYLVVGTHSRKLDGELMETLLNAGWHLEHEKPARMNCVPSQPLVTLTVGDGTQVWRNPRL
jgi:FkbM family methyltransferase